jgi:hypothetical protein
VVNALHSDYKGYLGSIIMEIKGRSRERGFTFFTHERRECNVEAHHLARFASSLPAGRFVWLLEPPPGLDMPVIFESI